jgi:hypothetical protein
LNSVVSQTKSKVERRTVADYQDEIGREEEEEEEEEEGRRTCCFSSSSRAPLILFLLASSRIRRHNLHQNLSL